MVIVGGGMVGYAFLAAAGKQLHCIFFTVSSSLLRNKSILLLERSPFNTFEKKQHYSNRVVALNGLSKNLLKSINAWDFIKSTRLQPVKRILVCFKQL